MQCAGAAHPRPTLAALARPPPSFSAPRRARRQPNDAFMREYTFAPTRVPSPERTLAYLNACARAHTTRAARSPGQLRRGARPWGRGAFTFSANVVFFAFSSIAFVRSPPPHARMIERLVTSFLVSYFCSLTHTTFDLCSLPCLFYLLLHMCSSCFAIPSASLAILR